MPGAPSCATPFQSIRARDRWRDDLEHPSISPEKRMPCVVFGRSRTIGFGCLIDQPAGGLPVKKDVIHELEAFHSRLSKTSDNPCDLDVVNLANSINTKEGALDNSINTDLLADLKTRCSRYIRLRELNAPDEVIQHEYHWVSRLVEAILCDINDIPFILTEEEIADLELQAIINSD